MPDSKIDFAKFYIEQDSQKSNVYFAAAQAATVYYKILPGKVVYKTSRLKIMAALAVFLVMAVSFAAALSFYQKEIFSASADNSAAIKDGYDNILSAQKALAEFHVKQAFFDFNAAYRSFQPVRGDVSYLSALTFRASEYLPFASSLSGGKEKTELESDIAQAGMAIAKSVEPLLKAAQFSDQSLGDALSTAPGEMKNALEILKNTQKKLENSGESAFSEIAARLENVSGEFSYLIPRVDLAAWALGVDRPKTFLVAVENTGQARATGGVITSVGAITTEHGNVTKIFFDDVYNIDGQLQVKIIPPAPVQNIDTVWSLHNANWFLDFPTSAQKIAYFYQKSQGAYPDGVIVVNEKALEKFLELTGPVELLKYDLTIDGDNFKQMTALRTGDDKMSNQAKRVFNDFASAIFEKLFALPDDKVDDFLRLIQENTASKDILVWLGDEKYERVILDARWGGEVPNAPDADYLSVAVTDLNEADAGAPITQNISKQTEITNRGEVINDVTVERKYRGDELLVGKPDKAAPEYVRLYAPSGSELISSSGASAEKSSTSPEYAKDEFKTDKDVAFSEQTLRVDPESGTQIFQESGKTVFGAWIKVSRGAPAVLTFKYKLPFLVKSSDRVSFVFQKQPGVESKLNFRVFHNENPDPVFSYDDDFSKDLFFDVPK